MKHFLICFGAVALMSLVIGLVAIGAINLMIQYAPAGVL